MNSNQFEPRVQDSSFHATGTPVPSVNYHLWEPCNMRCKFCFAGFKDVRDTVLPKGHLPRQQTLQIVDRLADGGFDKITFVGGEPLLCPWLPDLIDHAHALGMTTMIVTNGSRLTEAFLDRVQPSLNWVTLSVDSSNADTLRASGRSMGSQVISSEDYLQLAEQIRSRGIRLKINTVVHWLNWNENMVAFIAELRPERWKLFQVLPVDGQNSGKVEPLLIGDEKFQHFVETNRLVEEYGIVMVPEPNDLMRASYVMVDPAGRFFDSSAGGHTYSRPILEVGVREALRDVTIDVDRFTRRAGHYNWREDDLCVEESMAMAGGVA